MQSYISWSDLRIFFENFYHDNAELGKSKIKQFSQKLCFRANEKKQVNSVHDWDAYFIEYVFRRILLNKSEIPLFAESFSWIEFVQLNLFKFTVTRVNGIPKYTPGSALIMIIICLII